MEKFLQILKPNKSLNSDIFNDDKTIKSDFLSFFQTLVVIFNKMNNVIDVKDYHIVGSLFNYNYTDNSDIDFHIIVSDNTDVEKLEKLKDKINKSSIKYKKYPVEIYFQKESDIINSSAIYSALNNIWIKKPLPFYSKINDYFILLILKNLREKYLVDITKEKAINFKKTIKKMRKLGLENGEYDELNILFKILRNSGFNEKLNKYIKD